MELNLPPLIFFVLPLLSLTQSLIIGGAARNSFPSLFFYILDTVDVWFHFLRTTIDRSGRKIIWILQLDPSMRTAGIERGLLAQQARTPSITPLPPVWLSSKHYFVSWSHIKGAVCKCPTGDMELSAYKIIIASHLFLKNILFFSNSSTPIPVGPSSCYDSLRFSHYGIEINAQHVEKQLYSKRHI